MTQSNLDSFIGRIYEVTRQYPSDAMYSIDDIISIVTLANYFQLSEKNTSDAQEHLNSCQQKLEAAELFLEMTQYAQTKLRVCRDTNEYDDTMADAITKMQTGIWKKEK